MEKRYPVKLKAGDEAGLEIKDGKIKLEAIKH